jgi:hypothetical protein
MIIEKSFNCLKNELLKTFSDLHKDLLANSNYSNPEEYEKILNGLYFDFVKEVRDNLIQVKDDKESRTYLESLSNMLAYLNETMCLGLKFPTENLFVNGKSIPKELIFDKDQVLTLMLKVAQRPIVKDALDCLKGLLNGHQPEHYLSNSMPKSWQEELKDFYPEISRIKGELSIITSIPMRIEYLQKERKRLAEIYRKEGIDIYNSAINYFFESRIEDLKEVYLLLKRESPSENGKLDAADSENEVSNQNSINEHLHWTASKSDLVELVYGLYHANAVDQSKVSIQELANALGNLFRVELGDVYRTFLEIRNRKLVQIKFLDQVKSSLQNKIYELDEKM